MKTEPTSARSTRHSASFHGVLSLLLIAVILVGINVWAFKHYAHQDLSKSQFNALSPKTKDVLQNLTSPMSVTTLFSSKAISPNQQQQIDNLLKEYERVGGDNFKLSKVDPAFDMERAAELQKRLQFDGSENLVIFEYKGNSRFVKQEDLYETNPMTGQPGPFKGEQQFTAAMVALIEGKASKIYFTAGHGEHATDDAQTAQGYGLVAQTLKNENVETATLNLAEKGDVPADASAVVIAGPQVAFSPVEAQALDHYLSANGKLFILADPLTTSGLDDLLKKYGLQLDNDLVLYRVMNSTGQQMTLPLAYIDKAGFSSEQPITQKFAQANLSLQLMGARSITLAKDAKGQGNPKAAFLLQTDADAWGWVSKPGAPEPATLQNLSFDKATDLPGPLIVAAEYDGGTMTDPKTQTIVPGTRIVLVGSSRFLRNDSADTVGVNFFTNCIDWLVKTQPVLDISPKTPEQYGLTVSPIQGRTIRWIALAVIPGIALIFAVFTWLSRRK